MSMVNDHVGTCCSYGARRRILTNDATDILPLRSKEANVIIPLGAICRYRQHLPERDHESEFWNAINYLYVT